MTSNKANPILADGEAKIPVSPYLPGLYKQNMPWWPFVLAGVAAAVAIGLSLNFDLGFSPLLIPIAIVGLFIVILIIQRPDIGAYLIIISVFTNFSDILTDRGLPAINRPLIAITMGSVFLNYYLKTGRYNEFPRISKPEWGILAYFLAIVVSVIILPDKSTAFTIISDITKDLLVGVCVYITLNTQEQWKKGLLSLVVTVTILSAIGDFKTITGSSYTFFDLARNSLFGQVGEANELRYGGPIGEANIWGQVLLSTLPFILYLVNHQQARVRTVLVISGLLILLAVIFTSSRGAFVSLILILPLIARERKINLSTLLIGALLFIGLINLLPDTYARRFTSLIRQDSLSSDESITGRTAAMRIGLEMFYENPILGVGFSNYTSHYWDTAEKLGLEANATNVDYTKDATLPHSLYIEILSETGLVGLITFFLFIYVILKELYNIRRKFSELAYHREWIDLTTALAFSISTFLISGLFLHGIFFRFIWVLLGLAMAAISISEKIDAVPFVRQGQTSKLTQDGSE